MGFGNIGVWLNDHRHIQPLTTPSGRGTESTYRSREFKNRGDALGIHTSHWESEVWITSLSFAHRFALLITSTVSFFVRSILINYTLSERVKSYPRVFAITDDSVLNRYAYLHTHTHYCYIPKGIKTQETRLKLSISSKANWGNPLIRANIITGMQASMNILLIIGFRIKDILHLLIMLQ